MRRAAGFAAIVFCLPAHAEPAPRWTFCVAAAQGGAEVWISEVFLAQGSRERLEGDFKSAVERLGGAGASALCPNPRLDKTVAENAQFDVEAFNRKTGVNVHTTPANAFPGRR
jgi:hypothetical protein